MLFCIYTRRTKIEPVERNTLIKYADDSTAILQITKSESIKQRIDSAIDMFAIQCSHIGLRLNQQKTQILVITKKKNVDVTGLKSSTEIKILGLIFNNKLNWSSHINSIAKKASTRLFPLRKLRELLSKEELVSIYKATIRSLLEYGHIVMVGMKKKEATELQKIENRALRIIHCDSHPPRTFETLSERRKAQAVKAFMKAANSDSNSIYHLIPEKLPNSRRFRQPTATTDRRRNSFVPYVTIILNGDITDNI